MELHQLRYFCSVALTGSFTKAAAQEGIAQPSLSQQIDKLERTIGARLFDRLGRSLKLTEAGQTLLPQAVEILRMVYGAQNKLRSLRHGVGGRLVVGCIPTIMPYFLAPRVSGFVSQYPEVQLRLVEDITPALFSLLQTGEIDLAIVSPPVLNPELVCSELFREPILVAVGRQHKYANAPSIKLPDLESEKLLLLKEGHCFRDSALTVCTRAKTSFVSIFETNQFSSILPLVSAGFGISLVPEMAAQEQSGCSFLRLEREAHRRVGYVRVRQHTLGPAQKTFIQWLRAISKERNANSS
jgi:LysR family transcriptional regulator, hydrogen peroxide-inducible genes activator